MDPNNTIDIRTKDLVGMALLKLKFPLIFRDIELNKDLYTQVKPGDRRLMYAFMDNEEERKEREKHFHSLLKGYQPEEVNLIRSILDELFPSWNTGNDTEDTDSMQLSKRIGHRDLLDLYFAYGTSHELFKERITLVQPILDQTNKPINNQTLMRRMYKFSDKLMKDPMPGDAARLFARRLLNTQLQQKNRDQYAYLDLWRCWLYSFLEQQAGPNGATNSVLSSILSGANRACIIFSSAYDSEIQEEKRAEAAGYIFANIMLHVKDPYSCLLMLLFILPERGNNFFGDFMSRDGYSKLFEPVLSYVDEYFLAQLRDVFRVYEWPNWSFVLYQWSLSISTSSQHVPNRNIKDAEKRHEKVNNYVFDILSGDTKLTYDFIRKQFWGNDGWSDEPYSWRIASKIAQYDNERDMDALLISAQIAINDRRLSQAQKNELKEFKGELEKYKADKKARSKL